MSGTEADLLPFAAHHTGPCPKCRRIKVRPVLRRNVNVAAPYDLLCWQCDCGWEAQPTRTADADAPAPQVAVVAAGELMLEGPRPGQTVLMSRTTDPREVFCRISYGEGSSPREYGTRTSTPWKYAETLDGARAILAWMAHG